MNDEKIERIGVSISYMLMVAGLMLILLAITCTPAAAQDCEANNTFAPSMTVEITAPMGIMLQAGITGQRSIFSMHAGLKAIYETPGTKKDNGAPGPDVLIRYARLEISARVYHGFHIAAGVAQRPDMTAVWYGRLTNQLAGYLRAGYDRGFICGAGLKFLFINPYK